MHQTLLLAVGKWIIGCVEVADDCACIVFTQLLEDYLVTTTSIDFIDSEAVIGESPKPAGFAIQAPTTYLSLILDRVS